MQQLSNLTTIFKNKIFRIPDYQRGYAWQPRPQLVDFWEDLMTLEEGKNHYTGVLTLEAADQKRYKAWTSDLWLIQNKGLVPYFIVDGQQRLTTCIILIQAILDVALILPENKAKVKDDFELCDTSLRDIRKQFIYQSKTGTILKSYIFGYESDNPSYEFLITRIFGEKSSSNQNLETLYTHNLENAKTFFIDNLNAFDKKERITKIESIYRKVTMSLMFNEYIIEDDIDVYVAFETMNNRGKKLSDLELMKNRLIYLSTLYRHDENEKNKLRIQVNDCWKTVYYQLGKSKTNPLNDDDFLQAHWIMYFKYSRKTGSDYINFLLSDAFSPKKVLEQVPVEVTVSEATEVRDERWDDEEENGDSENGEVRFQSKLKIPEISKYALSLRDSSEHWYNTFNPIDNRQLTKPERIGLDRLNRMGINYFRPLVMSSFLNKDVTPKERVKLFDSIERFIFLAFRLSQQRGNYANSEFYNAARELYYGESSVDDIIGQLDQRLEFTFNDDGTFKITGFADFIENKFKYYQKNGFYGWSGLRYFLYEYEMHLFGKSKNETQKISWNTFVNQKDWISIEHIFPQTPDKKCWQKHFKKYNPTKTNQLTNTLGNLLALSQPKNSSLQNDCYKDKRADEESTHGYFNGSYSEIRVAEMYEDWTPTSIRGRGLELLKFMEERWNIELGTETDKVNLLNISFVD